ncbi:hypothetical protein [Pyxidicoccus sp. MSG2]|uniref:hypothetical protein n=1 Tax=Pyxidicoccus sp. MSG2 TaxID=2996790 RepID=UPI00226F9D99|nr:hypothetical protein [Pyxidicoccus sp. MSG2]MCY1023089.1 hypothetical protein [Pyxidicoccus sp. MSG2]
MRGVFLVVALLFVGPSNTQAAEEVDAPARYTQADEGQVRISGITGRNLQRRKHLRGPWTPYFEQTITVDNRLDLELLRVKLDVGYERPDSSVRWVRRERSWLLFNARGPTPVTLNYDPPMPELEAHPTAVLVSYRLAASGARTPGFTRALFLLSNSKGAVDLAVAAEELSALGPDATLLREEVRKWVAGGPLGIADAFGQGITPLYALRLLGRVGTGEDVPLLLSVLKAEKDYAWYLPSLEELRARLPDHPMTNLFASGAKLERIVEDAVMDLQPALAVPALVAVAYQEGPHRNVARGFLRKWKPEELVDLLRGPGAVDALRVLCASRAPDAVPIVLRLGVTGVDGVDLKACLSAMPEKETNAALVGALGEELGSLEDTVLSLLAARGGAVRAPLRARASKLELKEAAADSGALARAIHARLRSERVGALQETLDAVDGALSEQQFDTALTLLEKAATDAQGREHHAKLAVAHARVAQAAARARDVAGVDKALERIAVPGAGREHEAGLEPELTEVARALMSQWKDGRMDRLDSQLERVEARVKATTRPELARIYMDAIGDGRGGWERAVYAKRALALDSSNVAARQYVEEYEREEAREEWLWSLAKTGGGLLAVGLFMWFIVSKLSAATA